MPCKIFQILTALVVVFPWCNAYAELLGVPDTPPASSKTIYLPAYYDFGKPKSHGENVSVLWVDTIQLLNHSIWEPQSKTNLLPIDKAIDYAIGDLSASGVRLSKTQLLSCTLYPLFFDAAEDVWVYEVVFDSAAQTPASDGQRLMNLQRVMVMMDGSAYTYMVRSDDEIRANFRKTCAFKKEGGLWRQDQCIAK